DKQPALLTKAVALVEDPHLKVRLQLAFSLGESQDAKVLEALARLADRDASDPWMRTAILSAVPTRAGRLAEMILSIRNDKTNADALLQPLAAVVGARRQAEEVSTLLQVTQEFRGADSIRVSLLTGLAEGLGRARPEKVVSTEGVRAVERLLEGSSPDVKQHAVRIAGLLQITDAPGIRAVRAAALKTALDASRPENERMAALNVLTGASASALEPLHALLSPRQPLDLQVATVQVLGSAEGTGIVPILLKDWPIHTPRVRTAIVDAICSRQDRLPLLLDAIEKGVVEPSSLLSQRQMQLLENPDPKVRERAKALL